MKRHQGREIDFELSQLHSRRASVVNATLLRLLESKDKLTSTGACKAIQVIVSQHWTTGQLLAKGNNKTAKPKIELVSTGPSSSISVHPTQALLIENLAHATFDAILAGTASPKPTISAVIFADTLATVVHILSHTLRDPAVSVEAVSTHGEQVEENREALLEKVKKSVTPLLSRLLTWYGSSRPLYEAALRSLLQRVGGDWEKQLDAAESLFGELLEFPFVGLIKANWPLESRITALSELVASQDSTDMGQGVFDKLFKLATLLSKAPSGLRPSLWQAHQNSLSSTLSNMLFAPLLSAPTVALAIETLRFVGFGTFDFEARFWTQLKNAQAIPHREALFACYMSMPRTKEARVAMLNKVLQSWSSTKEKQLSANSHQLLVFILTHPQDCPDIFSSLSAYVQKHAHIERIQTLIDESTKSVES